MTATEVRGPAARPAARPGAFGAGAIREWAVAASAAAALAHALAVPAHWASWPAAGVVFVALAAAQSGFAAGLVVWRHRAHDALLIAAMAVNTGAVLLYVASRTVVLPFAPARGPHGTGLLPGRPVLPATVESVGVFDLFTLLVEVALVVLLLALLPDDRRRRAGSWLLAVGGLVWGFGAVAVLR